METVQPNFIGNESPEKREVDKISANKVTSSGETVKGKNYAAYVNTREPLKFNCSPCGNGGKHVEAQGFCSDCEEYFCKTCFVNHSKGRATRHHTLLDKEYIRWMTVKTCDSCRTTGADISVEGYCAGCNKYLCKYCYKNHLSKEHEKETSGNMSKKMQKYAEKCNYVRDLKVKVDSDKKNCFIVAMTSLSKDGLAIVDQNNMSLKYVDLREFVIKYTFGLESKPYGVTTVSEKQVAVSLSEICVIQILNIDGKISIQSNINVSGISFDVECLNGKLFASFVDPVKFQIIQLRGVVMTTINANVAAKDICQSPRYIAINAERRLIYVSDREAENVICIDENGNLKYIQQNIPLNPNDVTISPSGAICVCSRRHHAVYQMTPDLSDVTVMLGAKNGLVYPQAVCFNVNKLQVYVSSGSENPGFCNIIKLFNVR